MEPTSFTPRRCSCLSHFCFCEQPLQVDVSRILTLAVIGSLLGVGGHVFALSQEESHDTPTRQKWHGPNQLQASSEDTDEPQSQMTATCTRPGPRHLTVLLSGSVEEEVPKDTASEEHHAIFLHEETHKRKQARPRAVKEEGTSDITEAFLPLASRARSQQNSNLGGSSWPHRAPEHWSGRRHRCSISFYMKVWGCGSHSVTTRQAERSGTELVMLSLSLSDEHTLRLLRQA